MYRDYSKTYARSKYYDEAKPWNERCDLAFACASQNEIDQSDATNLVNSGCRLLIEGSCFYKMQPVWLYFALSSNILTAFTLYYSYQGSNMPCTPEAVDVLRKANVLVAPAMAAGAGGVLHLLYLSYL